jgi:AcrR family transcriptional regulator
MAGRASAKAAYETRLSILRAAADLASVEGLDAVTIGRLADRLEMSKSGVIGQFGSKERLQLETVDHVSELFVARVWAPVERLGPGLPRLLATVRGWVDYTLDPGFPGGCFLAQAAFDYDGRAGAVHDRIARKRAAWRTTIRRDVEAAVAAGELPAGTDPGQVAYGIESLITGITPARLLHGDHDQVEAWTLTGIHALLGLPAPAR